MRTENVTRTVKLPLETSQRKNRRVRAAISEWQSIAKTVADHHPSFPEYEWGRTKQNPSFYRIARREHPDTSLHSHGQLAAVHKVGSAFQSWRENGFVGDRPAFGNGDYCRFTTDGVELAENDRGYGLKVKLEPYDPEWWQVNAAEYHREYLEAVVDGDSSLGSVELHLRNGTLTAHAAVSKPVSIHEWGDCERVMGVDMGDRVLYAAAIVDDGSVSAVTMESGREFRHTRERLKRKQEQLMGGGELRKIKAVRNQYYNYTDHVTHVAARELVNCAEKHQPIGIAIEDLTHYRQDAPDPIHDWPYAELQEKVLYKATDAGIPVTKVNPTHTSIRCRKCGLESAANRSGTEFDCHRCGYAVHADVNAAINIATTATQ